MEAITMRRLIRKKTPGSRLKSPLLCSLILICCASQAVLTSQGQASVSAENKVRVVGDFSRIALTREDAFGYALQLWQQGDQLFGLLNVYTGAPSDPPAGLLEDVRFDPRTRKLSFS